MKGFISCPKCGYKNKIMYKYCTMCFERLHYLESQNRTIPPDMRRAANITKILFAVIIILILLVFAKFGLFRF